MPTERVVNPVTYFNVYYQDHSLLYYALVCRFYVYAYQNASICLKPFHALYPIYHHPIRV